MAMPSTATGARMERLYLMEPPNGATALSGY
jgi:hypothetical protein